jgi:FAD/FMN-containing dehydrogenase
VTPSWQDPAEDELHIAAARAFVQRMMDAGIGAKLYPALAEDFGDDVVASYWGQDYALLAEVKAEYDPENLFRGNANIKPAGLTNRLLT